jgi:hypothetical protein
VTAVLAVVALLAALGAGPAAAATAPAPAAAAPTRPEPQDGPRPAPRAALRLVAQTDWVPRDGTFTIRVAVPEDAPAGSSLVLDVHRAVTSRSQFAATQTGALLGRRLAEVVVPLDELPVLADGSRRVHLTPTPSGAPGERELPELPGSGVHPVSVTLRPADLSDEDEPTGFVTYLVRTPDTVVQPLVVAVVQPFEADLAHAVDGSVDLPPGALPQLAALAEVLEGNDVPLSIAPRGETLEALAALAATGDEAATGALDALRAATRGRQVVTATFVDVDLGALEAAGLGEDVGLQRDRGDEAVRATLGVRSSPGTWLADGGVGQAGLRRLDDLGVDQVVVPDPALDPVALDLTLTRPFALPAGGGASLAATAPDPALTARYAATGDVTLAAQRLLADLAVLHGDEPGARTARGVVVAPPPGSATDPAFLAEVLAGVATAPILRPTTLDAYFADVAPQADGDDDLLRRSSAEAGMLGIPASEIRAARTLVQGFSSVVVLDDGADPTGALFDRTLLAEAAGLGPEDRRAHLAAVGAHVDEALGSIDVVDRAAYRLADSEGTIPLTLVHRTEVPVRVRVTLASDKLEFGEGDQRSVGQVSYDLTLTEENTPLVVPVSVRSPGTFPLVVSITSPDGRLEILETRITVRSTAFSGVGIALSVSAGAFLLLWWGRHWRTVRRAKRLVPAP